MLLSKALVLQGSRCECVCEREAGLCDADKVHKVS